MKYTATKIKQAQLVGKVKIEPNGGDLNKEQVDEIKKDPWGRELIRKGYLVIEGVKPSDVEEPKKGSAKQEPPKQSNTSAAGNTSAPGNAPAEGNAAAAGGNTGNK